MAIAYNPGLEGIERPDPPFQPIVRPTPELMPAIDVRIRRVVNGWLMEAHYDAFVCFGGKPEKKRQTRMLVFQDHKTLLEELSKAMEREASHPQ